MKVSELSNLGFGDRAKFSVKELSYHSRWHGIQSAEIIFVESYVSDWKGSKSKMYVFEDIVGNRVELLHGDARRLKLIPTSRDETKKDRVCTKSGRP